MQFYTKLIIRKPYTGSSSRLLKQFVDSSQVTDVNLSLVQILLKANNYGRSHSPEFSLSPAVSDFQTFSPQSFKEAIFEFPSEVPRVTSHQTEDSQSGLPGMSLLVWNSPIEVIRNSLPGQQPRIYFLRQQSRRFYPQPSRIHVSLAGLAHQLTYAYITFMCHKH